MCMTNYGALLALYLVHGEFLRQQGKTYGTTLYAALQALLGVLQHGIVVVGHGGNFVRIHPTVIGLF